MIRILEITLEAIIELAIFLFVLFMCAVGGQHGKSCDDPAPAHQEAAR